MSNAVMNICVKVFVQTCVFSPLESVAGSGTAVAFILFHHLKGHKKVSKGTKRTLPPAENECSDFSTF